MTNKPPPRPPSFSQYRPSDERPERPARPAGRPLYPQDSHQAQQQGNGYPGQPGGHPPRAYRGHGAGQRPDDGSGFGIGRILLYALVAVLAVFAAGLTFLIISPPTDLIRSQVTAAVKEKTGRDLKIGGPTSISFYPSIGISMSDVSLSAPPEMGGPPLAKIADLTVAVKLLPLLSSEVQLDTLILNQPEFDLRVDAKGRKSWEFARHVTPGPSLRRVRLAQARVAQNTTDDSIPPEAREFLENSTGYKDAQASEPFDVAALGQLRLGDVRIIDGTVRYTDVPQNTSEVVKGINVKLDLPSIDAPFKADGDVMWKGEKIAFDATLLSLRSLLGQKPAKLETKISGRPVTANFDGVIQSGNTLTLDGALTANSNSMRVLAGWLGTELPKVTGFGPLSIQGRLKANGPVYSILNAKIGLDGATATGNATVTTGGVRPHIKTNLKVSELDLNKYISDDGASAGGGASPSPAANPRKKGQGGATGPQVRGYTKRAGWSRDPIDLSALGAVDADADLTVGRLLYQKIVVDRSRLDVKLKDKVMRADLTEMQLYKGSGRGLVTIDATAKKSSAVTANFAVGNVAVQPFLTDAAELSSISGTGNLTLAVSTRGASQDQFVRALAGKATFNFVDGAIVGFNLPAYIRSLSSGQFAQLNQSDTQKTDFSELSASFNIKNGIATNSDLMLASPLLRASGAGDVFLPNRTIDYTVKPKLVAALEGQGGESGLSGIVVPVRIHGSLDDPEYSADFRGILENPEQTTEVIKQVGEKIKALKGKKPQEILDGIFGGGSNGGDGGGADGASAGPDGDGQSGGNGNVEIDAKKLLDGLFGN